MRCAPTLKPPPGLRYRAFLAAYAGVITLAELLVWQYFRKRAKADPAYMDHPEERRGEGAVFDADLWVHAVSIGEFTSAAPLIRLALDAGYRVRTTHATPAGRGAFASDLNPIADLADTQILLGNSMREMFFYLSPANAVVVGGGFTEKGAHNVIEPLSLGKPVITGPYTWTIEFPAVEAEAAGVLTVVPNPRDLSVAVHTAMTSGGPAAVAFHAANQGASARILEAIAPLLEPMV